MRRFHIRRARHSVGRLQQALRQTGLSIQRIRQARALPRPTGIHLPQPSSAKTKLPQRTVPAQQTNEHAGVTDSQIRPDKIRSFCPSAAKMNGSSPLSRPKETIIRAAPPIRTKYRPNCPSRASENAKNRSLCPTGVKTSDSSQFTPRGQHTPRFAPAFNLREAATEPGAAANRPPPCASRTMPMAECASGTWGCAGAGAAASRSSSMVRASLNWRASSSIGSRGR